MYELEINYLYLYKYFDFESTNDIQSDLYQKNIFLYNQKEIFCFYYFQNEWQSRY